jgi:hypothetical protein
MISVIISLENAKKTSLQETSKFHTAVIANWILTLKSSLKKQDLELRKEI